MRGRVIETDGERFAHQEGLAVSFGAHGRRLGVQVLPVVEVRPDHVVAESFVELACPLVIGVDIERRRGRASS
jgi:hypothetical protein